MHTEIESEDPQPSKSTRNLRKMQTEMEIEDPQPSKKTRTSRKTPAKMKIDDTEPSQRTSLTDSDIKEMTRTLIHAPYHDKLQFCHNNHSRRNGCTLHGSRQSIREYFRWYFATRDC